MSFVSPSLSGWTIYSKSNCKFCSLVKELLVNENEKNLIIDCDSYLEEDKRVAFLDFIRNLAKKEHKTFPMVFLNGEFIGGYTDTKKHIEYHNVFSCIDEDGVF